MTSTVDFIWPHLGSNRVQLAGNFNSWQPQDMYNEDNVWKLRLDLPPGNYQFKFVTDGNWVHDETAPSTANELGSCNNVITVSESQYIDAMSMSLRSDDSDSWEVIDKPSSKLDNSKTPKLEVERKFIVPDNYNDRLIANGFKLIMEFDELLVDKYFDTRDHLLLAKDFWLRQRNGDWELKYPVGIVANDTSLYHETTNHEDILAKLRPILDLDEAKTFGEVVDRLEPFANLETRRKCYNRDDVNIVIDVTDWGYSVGEIEVMVTEEIEVANAAKKIELLAIQLDFAHMDLNALCRKTSTSTR